MARPQPAKSGVLQTRRPDTHPLAPVTNAAPEAEAPKQQAADEAGSTAANAASRIAVEAEPGGADLRKFSIRVPPHQHRHIKVTAAQEGMSIQDLAVKAIGEYLDRLGHPLPPATPRNAAAS